VSKRTQHDQELHVDSLAAMLPATKSSRAEVAAQLVELGARFHGWLHQDEFGPRRGEQTAALRVHIKLVCELCQLLAKGSFGCRTKLNAALRNNNDGFSPAVAALGETAALVQSALQIADAPARDIYWISRVRTRAEELLIQIEVLDDNTDGQIAMTAICREFRLSQPLAAKEFGLVDVVSWLNATGVCW
jgi:hypothetical protein